MKGGAGGADLNSAASGSAIIDSIGVVSDKEVVPAEGVVGTSSPFSDAQTPVEVKHADNRITRKETVSRLDNTFFLQPSIGVPVEVY